MLPKILIEATIPTGTIEISKMNTRNILKTTNKTFSYICCFSMSNIMENYFAWLFITIDEPIFAYSNSFKFSVWSLQRFSTMLTIQKLLYLLLQPLFHTFIKMFNRFVKMTCNFQHVLIIISQSLTLS